MSDYPMLISNKLHSFRNFLATNLLKQFEQQKDMRRKYAQKGEV